MSLGNSHFAGMIAVSVLGCAAPRPPAEQLVATPCRAEVVDTSSWTRTEVGQAFTLLLPPGTTSDTSAQASTEFYHGGGRFRAATLTVEFGFLTPNQAQSVRRPSDWLPGLPACFGVLTKGWEARAAAFVADNRISGWFRRPERPQDWIFVSALGRDTTHLATLTRIVASVAPESSFWRAR